MNDGPCLTKEDCHGNKDGSCITDDDVAIA